MKEDSAIEEIFGRFRLFRQDAYHDDEDLDACWPVAADGIGRLRFVKVMLSSMICSNTVQSCTLIPGCMHVRRIKYF